MGIDPQAGENKAAGTVLPVTPNKFDSWGYRTVRWAIWIYIFFLLFEGVLRKWVLPGLSGPLLIIRDPIALFIYLLAAGVGAFPRQRMVTAIFGICIAASICGIFAASFNPTVYLFGLRTDFLHLPLIFVMGKVMSRKHIIRIGWWWLLISVPMAYLIAQQFDAAEGSILNTTAGQTGMQINTSGGKLRASGTFSYISGVVAFCSLTAAFVLYGLLRAKTLPRWLLLAGAASVGLSVATSGSRSAFLSIALVGLAALASATLNPKLFMRFIVCAIALGIVWIGILQLHVVKEGVEIMNLRFDEASAGEGGVVARFFRDSFGSLLYAVSTPFFGEGLGLGTNAGAAMATGGVNFVLSENEWGRLIQESGALVGLAFISWRIALALQLGRLSLASLRSGDSLALLLLGASGTNLITGQFGQPTMLGFSVVGAGLCLAAVNNDAKEVERSRAVSFTPPSIPQKARRRGRAPYAQILHRRG